MASKKKVTLIIVLFQFLFPGGFCQIYLSMQEKSCSGGWSRTDNIGYNVCYSWPSAGGGSRGINLLRGSCMRVFRSTGCSNSNGILKYADGCKPAHIYSAKECSRSTTSKTCPSGSYVNSIGSSFSTPKLSFSANCFNPDTNANNIITSHGSDYSKTSCSFPMRGISMGKSESIRVYTSASCSSGGCASNQALCGFTVGIEDYTMAVKTYSNQCCTVPHPANRCTASDTWVYVGKCDNRGGAAGSPPKSCPIIYYEGTRSVVTSSETQRFNFYTKYYSIVSSDALLITKMRSLGTGGTTGVNWNNIATTAFNVADRVKSISALAEPGVMIEYFQVVGKCFYYEVRATNYKEIRTGTPITTTTPPTTTAKPPTTTTKPPTTTTKPPTTTTKPPTTTTKPPTTTTKPPTTTTKPPTTTTKLPTTTTKPPTTTTKPPTTTTKPPNTTAKPPTTTTPPSTTTTPPPRPTTTVTALPTLVPTTGNPILGCRGQADGALLPHPHNCAFFLECQFGEAIIFKCPDGLHWNVANKQCDWPEIAQCQLN